eukprot:19957-Prymnesium_polylepis.1
MLLIAPRCFVLAAPWTTDCRLARGGFVLGKGEGRGAVGADKREHAAPANAGAYVHPARLRSAFGKSGNVPWRLTHTADDC